MKNFKRLIATICIVLCALMALCACDQTVKCGWELANIGDEVDMHTAAQAEFLAGDYNKVSTYAKGREELSRPTSVHLSWSVKPQDEGKKIVSYTVDIHDFEDRYIEQSFFTTDNYVDVYNLCVGTSYLWRVTAHFEDGTKSVSNWTTFQTADVAIRNLYVDGITNVRDLGGWHTLDGNRVRQGMIYRCGRLNKSKQKEIEIEITEDGIAMMRDVLGVKSEIDLRTPDKNNETGGITSSPLGKDINYYSCPLQWDQGNYLTYNIESVKYFFELASNENNYPFIFHCDIGTDRTGMFAFLINGLLGVSEDDLYYDYLFSNFGKINDSRSLNNIKNNYLKTINSCEGDTLSEKIENCLLTVVGVPQSQIDAIKAIMLEN